MISFYGAGHALRRTVEHVAKLAWPRHDGNHDHLCRRGRRRTADHCSENVDMTGDTSFFPANHPLVIRDKSPDTAIPVRCTKTHIATTGRGTGKVTVPSGMLAATSFFRRQEDNHD